MGTSWPLSLFLCLKHMSPSYFEYFKLGHKRHFSIILQFSYMSPGSGPFFRERGLLSLGSICSQVWEHVCLCLLSFGNADTRPSVVRATNYHTDRPPHALHISIHFSLRTLKALDSQGCLQFQANTGVTPVPSLCIL